MTNREFLQEIIRRVATELDQEEVGNLVNTMPENKTLAALQFEPLLGSWFSIDCIVNDIDLAKELLETVQNVERGMIIIKTKEAKASENN